MFFNTTTILSIPLCLLASHQWAVCKVHQYGLPSESTKFEPKSIECTSGNRVGNRNSEKDSCAAAALLQRLSID